MKKIVVFGGAFNPPHIGHATVIESVMRLFPCDEIWVIPSGDRRDKKIGVPGEHRLKMLQIMIDEFFSAPTVPIRIPTLELERPTLTITFDTKKELENEYPDYNFYFWVGYELIGDIKPKWGRGEELFNTTKFLTMERPGVTLSPELPRYLTVLNYKEICLVSVSSTFLRRHIAQGYSGSPYISPGVAKYIEKQEFYKE